MKLYQKNQVFTHIRFEGLGTATSEILDILGLGGSEKDILLSMTTRSAASLLLERLENPEAPVKEVKLGYAIVESESTGRRPI